MPPNSVVDSSRTWLGAANAGLPDSPIDERLLGALSSGMPECSGVALGLDRLMMVTVGASRLSEVIAFAADSA
jgi:elongation factor P--(R)-beta-lysine ligase